MKDDSQSDSLEHAHNLVLEENSKEPWRCKYSFAKETGGCLGLCSDNIKRRDEHYSCKIENCFFITCLSCFEYYKMEEGAIRDDDRDAHLRYLKVLPLLRLQNRRLLYLQPSNVN